MTTSDVVWNGSQSEARDLQVAVAHYCTCTFNEMVGYVIEECAAHYMLERDQRALDGLLFGRWISERLRYEEWAAQPRVSDSREFTDATHSLVGSRYISGKWHSNERKRQSRLLASDGVGQPLRG